MFGYVKAFKPELKMCEYEVYKSVYCGLCKTMGREYGFLSRFTLSYDFTFLAILAMSLEENKFDISPGRCCFNPTKKINICQENKSLIFSADMAIILLWHKLVDNEQDGGFFEKIVSRLGKMKIRKAYKKASMRHTEICKTVAQCMDEQAVLEGEKCDVTDKVCHASAHMLGSITQSLSDDKNLQRVLYRLGYLIGRYVYLADALDDLEKDEKTGNYNPFLMSGANDNYHDETLRERGRGSLYLTIGEIGRTYQLLDSSVLSPILENIIFLGLKSVVDEIFIPHKERPRKSSKF